MPEISKINALAIGSVAKVDGLAKASILDIDGVTVPGAYLLDTYANAEAAYSVRRLYSQYTGACMRVRRASDNIEADIGFDSNSELSLTSPVSNPTSGGPFTDFADFVGHGGTPTDGFVRTWYDQSQAGGTGSGNDAEAAASATQPKIYDATTGIIEEGSAGNEKPSLEFDGNDYMSYAATFATNIYYSFFAVRQLSGTGVLYGVQGDSDWFAEIAQSNTAVSIQAGFNGAANSDPATNTDYLLYRKDGAAAFSSVTTRGQYQTAMFDGNQHLVGFLTNGSPLSTTATLMQIGAYTGPALRVTGKVQEIIMFQSTTSNESSNAAGIETNINGFFNIYP